MLLLVTAALAGGPPADRAALWADCYSQPVELAGGGSAQCRSSMISGMELAYDATSNTRHVDTFLAGLKDSGITAAAETTAATVAGKAASQRALSITTGRAMVGTATWFDLRPRMTRMVVCMGLTADPAGAKNCAARTEDVVKNGWPDWLPSMPASITPMVVGRVLDVPAGCRADGQLYRGRIDCLGIGGGLLVYVQLAADPSAADIASIPGSMVKNLQTSHPGSTWTTTPSSCTLEGAAASCWTYTSPGASAVSAVGWVAGVPIMAQCTWDGAGSLPSPCTELVGGG